MITKKASARRYAKAVFEIAEENNTFDLWKSDLEKIGVVFQDVVLTSFLNSPSIHFSDKVRLVNQRFEDLNRSSINLLFLLISKGKMNLFDSINKEYQSLLNNHLGIQFAEVKSAIVLSEREKEKVAQWLGELTGKKVIIKTEVDGSLLGGIVARFDGKLLDSSIRNKLAALHNELASKH
ncbi:MAG: ATP synthase F1 subunit delta [Chloroflexi bacterium]|nr:ATP synthase F1 subunit delta [Chloroflexota bacterium]